MQIKDTHRFFHLTLNCSCHLSDVAHLSVSSGLNRSLTKSTRQAGSGNNFLTFYSIGTIEYLTANDEIICLVGKSQRVSEQWIVYRYEKEGKQVYAQNLALSEAYKSYWSLDNSHIDLIRNIEDETWVWHIDW